MMNEPSNSERRFKLDLTIPDDSELSGTHCMIALMRDEDDTPIVKVVAGGFAPNDTGAGELADMLRDVAGAIDDHLGVDRAHTNTDELRMPSVRRPRFNPQPRGPK